MPQGMLERIVSVQGPLDVVAKAFALISKRLADGEPKPIDDSEKSATDGVIAIHLLIPNPHMGAIIGKGGQKIKEIQDASNSRVQAAERILPNSNDRLVTITGVPDAIHLAVYHIGKVVEANPERSVNNTPYRPVPGYTITSNLSSLREGSSYRPVQGDSYHPPPRKTSPTRQARPAYGTPNSAFGHSQPDGVTALPVKTTQTQQIFIPNELVGSVIGKGGKKINEIRQMSGSNVKIDESVSGTDERLVTIIGTPENNQMALYLLYQRLEQEKMRSRK